MKNKLPKVYANKIDKEIKNNEKIYMSKNEQESFTEEIIENQKKQTTNKRLEPSKKIKKTINQKITQIMNTKNYIYKIPVKIRTKNEEIITKIIGKNSKNIITYKNELIKIEDIEDIQIDE